MSDVSRVNDDEAAVADVKKHGGMHGTLHGLPLRHMDGRTARDRRRFVGGSESEAEGREVHPRTMELVFRRIKA